ncbi:L-fucose:H+ symporter permease [Massilia cavernae]|uniref:L-fucose:H+ symporter permease n=1 Tax=Massilia cavernae TaxID=2320864 RepID=A0A418XQU8_9BURK|nr:L-fucose:H+ symporter permease [Massilia cavernae]RJG14782.1 L-fucose:H+ symporter permease [Massilia cavernae]
MPTTSSIHLKSAQATSHGPLSIITLLFFMWGLLTSLNDVLIPHLKSVYTLSYVQAMLVQFCFFGAYFFVSLPAGILVRRIGYQRGAVAGLLTAALGCALFYPAARSTYAMFLFAFFVLASGITILQVAANPFVAALGRPETASSRLNFTQAFNALGTAVAPTLGGILILSDVVQSPERVTHLAEADRVAYRLHQAQAVEGPYLILALLLLALALMFALIKLPQLKHASPASIGKEKGAPLLAHRPLLYGVLAIFLYVGGEVSIGSFLISFLGDHEVASLGPATAAGYVSIYWGGAMVGRLIGFAVMRNVSPGKVLACSAVGAMLLIACAIGSRGAVAMWSLLAVGLCNAIMFPTIFAMALHGLGQRSGEGAGLLCMAIVGGAVLPFLQGAVADNAGLRSSFLVPLACYAFILFYGLKYRALYPRDYGTA